MTCGVIQGFRDRASFGRLSPASDAPKCWSVLVSFDVQATRYPLRFISADMSSTWHVFRWRTTISGSAIDGRNREWCRAESKRLLRKMRKRYG